ncbi:MAG: hypothetical protein AAGI72_12780 [Pseudomonadota bacterium]
MPTEPTNLSKRLEADGYAMLPGLVPESLVAAAATELREAFSAADTIQVDSDGINITTLNGADLLSRSEATGDLYTLVLDHLRAELGEVFEVEDQRIGISANLLTAESNQFRFHFDRNQLTVIIYISASSNFPLVLYPLMRDDPRHFPEDAPPPVKGRDEEQAVKVYPRPGLVIAFWGRRTIHGIRFEAPQDGQSIAPRYSLQFAFDLEDSDYRGENYYGGDLSRS